MPEEELNSTMNGSVEVSATPSETSAVETTDTTSSQAETPKEQPVEVGKLPAGSSDANGNVEKQPPQFTELERAQYSFRKQFARQSAKHKAEIDDLKKSFDERLKTEIDKITHPEKYRPKTRQDFPLEAGGDDQYINYLVDQKMNQRLKEMTENYQREQEQITAQQAELADYKNMVIENAKKCYPTEESYKAFQESVTEATESGLMDLLSADKNMGDFIMCSPVGPKIIMALSKDRDAVDSIFIRAKLPSGKPIWNDPYTRMRNLFKFVDRLETQPTETIQSQNTATTASVQTPKPVGKPGVKVEATKDIFDDPKALLDWMS